MDSLIVIDEDVDAGELESMLRIARRMQELSRRAAEFGGDHLSVRFDTEHEQWIVQIGKHVFRGRTLGHATDQAHCELPVGVPPSDSLVKYYALDGNAKEHVLRRFAADYFRELSAAGLIKEPDGKRP